MKNDENNAFLNFIVLCNVVIFANLWIMYSELDPQPRYLERGLHTAMVMALGIFAISRKHTLSSNSLITLFVLVLSPFYLHIWNYHQDAMNAGRLWIPLFTIHIHVLLLSLIFTGSILMNAIMISGFIIEGIILTYYFDFADSEHTVFIDEPAKSILFYSAAAILLFFRTRNVEIAHRLSISGVKIEELQHRIWLSQNVRDRTNTPIQTLKTGLEVLKRKSPENLPSIERLESAVEELKCLSEDLKKKESDLKTDKERLGRGV